MTAVEQGLSAGEVMRRLTAEDYAVDAVTAAKALVGAWLCRRLDDGTVIRRRITETEAYCGEEDTASPATAADWRIKCRSSRTKASMSLADFVLQVEEGFRED